MDDAPDLDGADITKLWKSERKWKEKDQFLRSRGYMLPYRYRVDWKPSWKGKEQAGLEYEYEDASTGIFAKGGVTVPATRIDGKVPVMLKHVDTYTAELPILTNLSSEPLANHPYNHCVPLLDTIILPDSDEDVYLVFPQLRPFSDPSFQTPAEILHCFRHYLQGLQFLHDNYIAHLDIDGSNAMMDPGTMFPKGFNPVTLDYYRPGDPLSTQTRLKRAPRTTRTVSDVKYWFIDFGLARRYSMATDAPPPLEVGPRGHHVAPEMLKGHYDPMAADVFALGKVFAHVLERHQGWDDREASSWVKTLLEVKPTLRPTADDAHQDCERLIKSFSSKELKKRIYPKPNDTARVPPLADLYYTFRAVYSGTNVMYRELYDGIDFPSKDIDLDNNRRLPLRLLDTLRHFA